MEEEIPFFPTAADRYAAAVDRLFRRDVDAIGNLASELLERLVASSRSNELPERRPLYPLLLNALTTTVAALELWRRGLLLQEGILLRSAIETIATAAVITADARANELFRAGRYRSTRAFTDVKRAWPMLASFLGRANGVLSKEFSHIGDSYRVWQRLTTRFSENEMTALKDMLGPLKITLLVLDQLTEVICWESVSRPRYWHKTTAKRRYEYKLSSDGRRLMEHLVGKELADLGENG